MSFNRILLVKPSGRKGLGFAFNLIPIGLEYIAAYIEDAVEEVHIVDMAMEQRSFQHLLDLYCPDLVGITLSAMEHNEGLRLAKIAKKKSITTLVGGYHPTGAPDLMLSYPQVDLVVRGEGELTMKELVRKGNPEGVLGVSYKKDVKIIHNENRPKIEDLDNIPFPARYLRQYSYKAGNKITDFDVLVTSRGCNGLCSFCCEPGMSQSHLRCRSPENIIEEIQDMLKYHEGKPLRVIFADPNFMGNPKRVGHLCDLLQKYDFNIEFSALVRADNMAVNPEIVKKMCEVGITSFEMGIESPNPDDLKSTRKGITTKVHRDAVRNIRENGGRPGGTFVIGLQDQTEGEIEAFSVYAKEIGLTAAAFGVATPFPGTEFYKELDRQGLIFETNWDNFDEMHAVYRTKHLSKGRIEELATYSMAKFWNIDTFIDQEKVFQKRTRKKKPLIDFILERALNVRFMQNNGMALQKGNFGRHIKTFLKAYADPRVESYTRKVGIHNVLEMSRFLRILGPQTGQCTLNFDDTTVSFIFKTTKNTVEYIQIIQGKEDNTTIDFDIDLELLSEP
ncbi:MAG: radical SAM protein, partial [Candidatus Bathyarchaeota archaeon]